METSDQEDLSQRVQDVLQEFQRLLPADGSGAVLQNAMPAVRQLIQQFAGAPEPQLADLVEEVLDGLQALRQFVLTEMLEGREASPHNLSASIEDIIRAMQAPIRDVVSQALSRQALDCVHSVNSFLRRRLHDIITIIVRPGNSTEIFQSLMTTLMASLTEFNMLCRHFLPAGQTALDQVITSTVGHLLACMGPGNGSNPNMAGVGAQASRLLLDVLAQHRPAEHIRRYLVSADAATRMEEELYQGYENMRLSTPPQTAGDGQRATSEPSVEMADAALNVVTLTPANGQIDEAMEVVVLDGEEEVSISTSPAAPPHRRQAWHSAVSQDWIPVISEDINRQQPPARGGGRAPSDAYMCGLPYKRRRLAAQHKPRGTVNNVLQETVRASLRGAGVNSAAVVEAVSGEAAPSVSQAFATHMRTALRRATQDNADCTPPRFTSIKRNL